MTQCSSLSLPTLALASALIVLTAGAAQATTWLVPGDNSNTCTTVTPSCDTIAGALAAAAASGDTISIGAGTFTETDLIVNKSIIIDGAGIDATTIDSSGNYAFSIRQNDTTLSDLTIRNGADGTKIEPALPPITGTQILRVRFEETTSDGLEFSFGQIVNTTVTDSEFLSGRNGIRMASNSQVATLNVSGSTFAHNTGIGIYQANDGASSTLIGLIVTGSTFNNNGDDGGDAAIYAEEMIASNISSNEFDGNFRGILVNKFFSTSNADVSGITVADNLFTDSKLQAVEVIVGGTNSAGANIIIEDNVVEQDVGVLTANVGLIDIRLASGSTHNPLVVRDNFVQMSGTFGVATAAYGIIIRGNGPISMTNNVLLGGEVGGTAVNPPSSGIFLRTTDATFGTIPATASITGECNRIEGWLNGVSVWDGVGGVFGGLTAGATFNIEDSTIDNNDAGVVNGATPVVDFENNYWGCEEGPGNPGCDTVVGGVDADPVRTEPAECVACLADVECDDGLTCTGVETCDDITRMCNSGTTLVCDDSNDCTTEACVEPGGCEATDLPNGTGCNDGVTCSIADSCQGGDCDGGGTDADHNGTCDEDEGGVLNIVTASLKAQKPGKSNGKAITKATFVDGGFDASAPISIEIRDATLAGSDYTFSTGECITKGVKVKCKSTDKTVIATFKPDKNVTNGVLMKAKMKKLAIDGPFTAPLTVTLEYGAGVVREGSIGTCKDKPTSMKCK